MCQALFRGCVPGKQRWLSTPLGPTLYGGGIHQTNKYTQVVDGAGQGRTKGSGVGEEVTEGAEMAPGRRGLGDRH